MRPSVNESFRTSEVTARPSVNGGIDNFQPGDRVEINNLNVAPEFNGTMGTVEEWLATKKKWRVKCDYDGKDNKLASKYLTLKDKVKDDGWEDVAVGIEVENLNQIQKKIERVCSQV